MQSCQRTIARPVTTLGHGLHTGAKTTMSFLPADPDSGVRFVRVDLPGRPSIPARIDYALDRGADPRRTTLDNGTVQIETVEHVLAAVAGLGIDNIVIEIDASEPCEPDGSSKPFVDLLQGAGIVDQPELRHY
jgi:UDP-3-O-[3-hydroxymyristoyl] N-acetylglucosamine deacetylase/3-hydroxyacyl-[acyl-carrier-protein] dehydratase